VFSFSSQKTFWWFPFSGILVTGLSLFHVNAPLEPHLFPPTLRSLLPSAGESFFFPRLFSFHLTRSLPGCGQDHQANFYLSTVLLHYGFLSPQLSRLMPPFLEMGRHYLETTLFPLLDSGPFFFPTEYPCGSLRS